MKKYLFLFWTLIFFLLPSATLFARDDWQSWNLIQARVKTTESITLRVQGEQWLTSDFSKASLHNVDAGFLWRPLSFFEIGPFYRYQHVDSLTGPNTAEHRYYPEARLNYRIHAYEFSNRGRLEYRRLPQNHFWSYRNEVRAAYHFKIKKTPVSVYFSEEFFVREGRQGVSENRAAAGFQMRFHQHVGVALYYLVRHTQNKNDWKSDQVLGTTTVLYF